MADRFLTPERTWQQSSRWHLYWVPEQQAVHDLADAYAAAVADDFGDYFAVQPDAFRHATVGAVVDRSTHEITPNQREELHGRLAADLAEIEPVALTLGPVWCNTVSVILDVRPDATFTLLQERTATAITDVLGDGAAYSGAGRPHVSVAYASGPYVDSGAVASRMRAVTDQTATGILYRLHALDVTQDTAHSTFTWNWNEPLATIYLGTAIPEASSLSR